MAIRRRPYLSSGRSNIAQDNVPILQTDSTKAGFVVGPNAAGQPSYQFRTAPGAPMAQPNDLFTSGAARFAATFGGNSPLAVASGIAEPNSLVIARSAAQVYGTPDANNPLEQAISQAEAYHSANGLTLPKTSVTTSPVGQQGTLTAQNTPAGQTRSISSPYGYGQTVFRTDAQQQQIDATATTPHVTQPDYQDRLKKLAAPNQDELLNYG